MNQLTAFLQPPTFADKEKTRRAQTLHILLNFVAATFILGGSIGFLFIFSEKVVSGLALLSGLIVVIITAYLNRIGRVKFAATFLFTALWLMTTLLAILSGGMRSLEIILYLSGTIGVGLTLGTGGMLFYVAATVIVGLIMALLAQMNIVIFPEIFLFPPLTGWLLLVMNLAFTVLPLRMTLKILSDALTSAEAELAERRQAETNLQSRERILEAVTFAAEQFLKSSDWRDDINFVLERLGQSIDASHAYIFENHVTPEGQTVSSLCYEWTASGQEKDLDNPIFQNFALESERYVRFFEVLAQGQPLARDRTTMDEEERRLAHGREILALVDVPIWVNGRLWGIMGFDDCMQDRIWQPAEIDALIIAANVLSAVIERQQADEAMRLSEERYRVISSVSSDYTFSARMDEQGILHNNWVDGAFEQITGYNTEEFQAVGDWIAIVHPDDKEEDARAMMQLHQNQRVVSELRIVHKDGKIRWVRSYGHPIWDENENRLVGIYGAVQDITERKQVEEALRASEEKFAKAFRASPDAITISTLMIDSQFIEVNDSFLHLSGYTRQEVLNRPISELGLWPDPQERGQVVRQLINEGNIANKEIILHTKSGEDRNFLLSAERVEISGETFAVFIARDITERKQIEQQLEQERLLLRTVIDTLPDYIYLKDTEFRYLVSNIANARALGAQSPEEVEGRILYDFYSPEEAELNNAKDNVIMTTGQAIFNEENSFIDLATGQRRWAWMTRIPFRASDGRILGVVGMSRDITAYKESLLEQERLIAELQAKNAELERFTYTVSHDLKSPLVTIVGFLGFVEKDALSGNLDRLRQDVAKIHEAADQMKRLLNDLLELSRVGRLVNPPLEVPFGVIVHEALNMNSIQVAELGIEMVVSERFPIVHVDRLRLVEVMQNLLENAIKFMGNQPQPRIEIGVRYPVDGSDAIFFVQDNGIGIDAQYHETVFGLFNRLSQSIDGTGIGLALVKRIIETHGGRIWIESEGKGQGTTICFTLPLTNGV